MSFGATKMRLGGRVQAREEKPDAPNERRVWTQMQTISRLFDSHAQAARAVARLQAGGIRRRQISVVGSYNDNDEPISVAGYYDDEMSALWRGAGAGAALGATAGLLAGFSAFGAQGIDPAGMTGMALVGAAWGGFGGGLLGTFANFAQKPGKPKIAEGVVLVMARVDEKQAGAAQAVLRSSVEMPRRICRSGQMKTSAYTNSSRLRVQSGAR
ncbi:hypothetical protein NKH91_26035 [Mesorhizobium sp. M0894]|uniref:hypothetical protein n=2 Tax=unclassified Mesorhizobium TaxID=325217 RepID=UPI0033389F7F